jgi:hypothetical protein
MDKSKFRVLAALYNLESAYLNSGNRRGLATLAHCVEEIASHCSPDLTKDKTTDLLSELWRDGSILAWNPEPCELNADLKVSGSLPITPLTSDDPYEYQIGGEAYYSVIHQREIDDGKIDQKMIRSRVAETTRMLSFNRQRFDFNPSTATFSYKVQERTRPKRDILIDDAIVELTSRPNASDFEKKSISIVLEALKEISGPKIAQFQIESTRAALDVATPSNPLAIVAGVSSGKTIAFTIPALIKTVQRALEGDGGKVRALFVYPRATLVEDQFQRMQTWTNKINNLHGSSLLKGPALDAAGKLRNQVSSDKVGIVEALKLAFPSEGNCLELVFTTLETLKRRLQNPRAVSAYVKDLECIIMDEVHLLDGLQGSHSTQMMKRLFLARNYFSSKGKVPIQIAVSATIAEPDDHVAKLFNAKREDVIVRRPLDEDSEPFSLFHHLFLRTGSGQGTLSAITNGVSCLIHNRANGLVRDYYRQNVISPNGQRSDFSRGGLLPSRDINKTIGFVDSLSTIGSWGFTLADNEVTILDGKSSGEFSERNQRRYPYFTWFVEPLWKIPARNGDESFAAEMRTVCIACKAGRVVRKSTGNFKDKVDVYDEFKVGPKSSSPKLPKSANPFTGNEFGSLHHCGFFREGFCWWFSQDDETQIEWVPKDLYGSTQQEKDAYNRDVSQTMTFAGQVRSQPLTSYQGLDDENLLQDVNDLFHQPATSIFKLGRDFYQLRKRLDGQEVNASAPKRSDPWRENYSFLLASPKIEVGVDFDNVRDGVLHRAIRNVASYQQKSGRVGRESNSDSMIVTFMTQSPVDFYFYRNSAKLLSSNHLDPIPLKANNKDVISCHLFLCCFDFMSVNGIELMIVRGPNQLTEKGNPGAVDFDDTVRRAIDFIENGPHKLRSYLQEFLAEKDDELIDAAISKFQLVLRVLNYPAKRLNSEVNSSYTFASLLQRRLKLQLSPPLLNLSEYYVELCSKARDCERTFHYERHELELFADIRRIPRFIERGDFGGLEDIFEQVKPHYKKLKSFEDDIDADPEDFAYYSSASSLIKKTKDLVDGFRALDGEQDIACAFIGISQEYDNLLDAAIANGTTIPSFYYLESLLSHVGLFLAQYPFVLPQTFFEHPKSERVSVKTDARTNNVEMIPRPTVLFDLLPGSWTYRFGAARKSPCGVIEVLGGRQIGFIELSRMNTAGFESTPLAVPLRREDLPEDCPPELRAASNEIEILAPTRIQLLNATDRASVDRVLGVVRDGDELSGRGENDDHEEEGHGRDARTQTLPRTMARTWLKIEDGGSIYRSVESAENHPLSNKMFTSIEFTSDIRVTEFCYGLSRTYSSDVDAPALFYVNKGRSVCLGNQMVTDGIRINLRNSIVEEVTRNALQPGFGIQTAVMRMAIAGFLRKVCEASLFSASRVRSALLSMYVKEYNNASLEVDRFQDLVRSINEDDLQRQIIQSELIRKYGADEIEIEATNDRAERYIPESLETFQKLKSNIDQFGVDFVLNWARQTLVHSIALKVFQAACRTAGAASDQLGYFYSTDPSDPSKNTIYLFDKIEGGSGLCAIIDSNFFISNVQRKDNDQLATSDFLTEVISNLGSCPTHIIHQVCDIEASAGVEVELPHDLSFLRSDLDHCKNELGTPEILRWLQSEAPVTYAPGNLDQLLIIMDAADVYIPAAVESGLISAENAFSFFERAISGCVSGCPECLIDPQGSLYGPFLSSDYCENRMASNFLKMAATEVGKPWVHTARSFQEGRSLKLGVSEDMSVTTEPMVSWLSSDKPSLKGNTVEFESSFLFDAIEK